MSKLLTTIFFFAAILMASAQDAVAVPSYDMYTYSSEHYSYLIQGITAQSRILSALSGGVMTPIYIILVVYCLFAWVKRIATKGDTMNFAVWFCAFFVVSYMAFFAKTNIDVSVYNWEETKSTGEVRLVKTLESVPGINSFFAKITKFTVVFTDMIMAKADAKAFVSCEPMQWYVNAARSVTVQAYDKEGPEGAVGVFEELQYLQHSKIMGITSFGKGETITGEGRYLDYGKAFAALVSENAKKCELSTAPASGRSRLIEIRNAAMESPLGTDTFKEFKKIITDEKNEIIPIAKKAESISEEKGSFFTNILRSIFSWFAKKAVQLQPTLTYKIHAMLLAQAVITSICVLVFPFFLLYSFTAITDNEYGINFKLLMSFLAAFLFVQLWYPAMLFIKALVFKYFIT